MLTFIDPSGSNEFIKITSGVTLPFDYFLKTWLLMLTAMYSLLIEVARGPFLESPGNVSGPKSNFQIEI